MSEGTGILPVMTFNVSRCWSAFGLDDISNAAYKNKLRARYSDNKEARTQIIRDLGETFVEIVWDKRVAKEDRKRDLYHGYAEFRLGSLEKYKSDRMDLCEHKKYDRPTFPAKEYNLLV
ncbi:hypothetical protein J3Q64DRAFT_1698928 [Phycomyces blakesleeanus]|uniref:Uncharacterized protein n=1 Tax=Phycomyces blakesleeanus TaxID=4837 RepID=A0ABR3AY68_PHYBL